jgi:hypothetical protein
MSDVIDTAHEAEPQTPLSASALATIATLVPAKVFAPGGIDTLLTGLEAEVRAKAAPLQDISTEKNRKAIASLAYKVARSKTALDEMGKELGAEWKRRAGLVDADRRALRERLDALKAEVTAPLDRYEAEDTARITAHEAALAEIEALAETAGMTAAAVNERIWSVPTPSDRSWQEFQVRAERTIEWVQATLMTAHAEAMRREAQEAEVAAARAVEAARIAAENEAARIANEARIAANARAIAIIEADARAERERQAAALAIAAAEAKTAAAMHAADRAEADAAEAVEAERRRVAGIEAAEAAEAERRARSVAHRKRINGDILADMRAAMGDAEPRPDDAVLDTLMKRIIGAIARGEIRHVTLAY